MCEWCAGKAEITQALEAIPFNHGVFDYIAVQEVLIKCELRVP